MVLTGKNKLAYFNYWAFIASSLFLLSLAIFSLIWFQKEKNAVEWISHTYQVKIKIEKCFGLLLEAESNQRGYLLNNDSAYLKNISHAESLLRTSLNQLDSMVADNIGQLNNLNKLQSLILFRISRLQFVLDSSRRISNSSVIPLTLPGKILMDSIHNQVVAMQADEDHLLGQRTFFKKTQDKLVITSIVLFSILAFTILMWSFFKIKNESSLRIQAQMDTSLLEAQVYDRTLEIKKINNQLKDKNEKLERKNHDLTSFANVASHDLKEPLRKIQTFTNLIVESNLTNLSGKTLEYFNKISYQSKRMQILIESVLKYAQTDDDTFGFTLTNLNEIANLSIDGLSELIQNKKAIITINELPTIFCSPTQMEQLFTNLIDNGIKYSQANQAPLLEITATRLEEKNERTGTGVVSWKIDFRDNGIGFDEALNKKIFEIFQRLHSNDEYPGTGIGLAICKKITDNHRGSITAKSIIGEGSIFSITLPA